MHRRRCRNLAKTLADTRIQLCGRLVARIEGRRVEGELPGRQGRLLFAYLALNRHRPVPRDELNDVLWHEPAPGDRLSPLVSKLRRHVPLEGRSDLRLTLADDAWIDVEAAAEGLHRAEAAVAREDWAAAWGPGRVAQHISVRRLLQGEGGGEWIEEQRRRLDDLHLSALELVGRACLGIGGGELDTAMRAARMLIARAPFRESGYRLLMQTHAQRGNAAEALIVYDELRTRLRDELGAVPSVASQTLHRSLLG